MGTFLLTCNVCGAPFKSGRPGATDCGDARKHARINTERRTSGKKDDDKKGGKK